MKSNFSRDMNFTLAIISVILVATLLFSDTIYRVNLKSAKAEAFNEGRLRQCTYTLGCDMKSLKAELFDQQRNLDKQTKKSGN